MTINSMINRLSRPSDFVKKLMDSANIPAGDQKLTEWMMRAAIKSVELQARRQPSVQAIESVLRVVNVLMLRLTAMKSELRERLLFDMADTRQQMPQHQDDGTVQVFDIVNGSTQNYEDISAVLRTCEDSSSLSETVNLQFSPGQLVLTSDYLLGRVTMESAEDVYAVDLGDRSQTYSAKDLVRISNDDGYPLVFP